MYEAQQPHLVPENMAPVVLTSPTIWESAWTDSTKGAGGVVYGGEGTEQVEHAANQSFTQPLWPSHLQLALQPQLGPGFLMRQAQVPRRHQLQGLIKSGLSRV